MKTKFIFLLLIPLILNSCQSAFNGKITGEGKILNDSIQYHPVRVDNTGHILPWYSSNLGESYDTIIQLVWNFWKNMPLDSNGLRYYMNHQVWKPEHDMRGLGGDQFSMALSSWTLLYAYTGDTSIIANMKYIADYYLAHSLSPSTDAWPSLPFPYNTAVHSGNYDGDMRAGKGFLQPDKAANFACELVNLFKLTGDHKYLDAAEKIGLTLISNLKTGDTINSPLPFRIDARSGKTGPLLDNNGTGKLVKLACYTSNWTGLLMLCQELKKLDSTNEIKYTTAFNTVLAWMKEVPLKTNKWGPFFEDIPGWSDTQTNAITFAMFIIMHNDLFPDWQKDVKGILEWTYKALGNHEYEKYKLTVMNEQTVYKVPGNSHSSRQASVEIMYTELSGDTSYLANAIRVLNWATYTVDADGRNRYIRDDIWLTDGYGDYVRHYLRAMGALPLLAPDNKNRLLKSSSVVTNIHYSPLSISYKTFDNESYEIFRLTNKPMKVSCGQATLIESVQSDKEGWSWKPLDKGGILRINHIGSNLLQVNFK